MVYFACGPKSQKEYKYTVKDTYDLIYNIVYNCEFIGGELMPIILNS